MRKQYHLWPADTGFDAWEVDRPISLSRGLPVHAVTETGLTRARPA
jgi:hypothetical protein